MAGTAVDSRAARWSLGSATSSVATARPGLDSATLAARVRLVAGASTLQARVAERRCDEARSRLQTFAAVGAVAATASVLCAAVALTPAIVPDLISLKLCWAASAAAVLLGLVPSAMLGRVAMGRPVMDGAPAAAMASATTLAALGTAFGRALASIDADANPEVAQAVGLLLGVIESEAGAAAQAGRPRAVAAPARRHRRIVPLERRVVVRTADGRKLMGTIADVSLSGVALTATLPRVAVGEKATVGTHEAVVARLWDKGIAFQFERELDPATFDEAIVL